MNDTRRYEEPWPMKRVLICPLFWGVIGSLAVTVMAAMLALGEECGITGSCESRWDKFLASEPHEMGLALGGFGILLAVVWLVVLAWFAGRAVRRMGR